MEKKKNGFINHWLNIFQWFYKIGIRSSFQVFLGNAIAKEAHHKARGLHCKLNIGYKYAICRKSLTEFLLTALLTLRPRNLTFMTDARKNLALFFVNYGVVSKYVWWNVLLIKSNYQMHLLRTFLSWSFMISCGRPLFQKRRKWEAILNTMISRRII